MTSEILPILEFDELIEIFEYPSKRSAKRAIANGTFPVPVFTMAYRTVAHVDAVELYFSEQRKESMEWLRRRYGIKPSNRLVPTEPRLDLYRKLGQGDMIIESQPAKD
jgi:hypothetical protein